MKAKFTIVKPSQKAWFIACLSKLCLFRWHLVVNFEKHFVTLLNLHAPTIYTCAFDLLHAQSFDYQSSGFWRLLERSLPFPTTFRAVLGNFHFIRLKYNYNFVNNRNESVHSEIDER